MLVVLYRKRRVLERTAFVIASAYSTNAMLCASCKPQAAAGLTSQPSHCHAFMPSTLAASSVPSLQALACGMLILP